MFSVGIASVKSFVFAEFLECVAERGAAAVFQDARRATGAHGGPARTSGTPLAVNSARRS
jgi:hypothetical protein